MSLQPAELATATSLFSLCFQHSDFRPQHFSTFTTGGSQNPRARRRIGRLELFHLPPGLRFVKHFWSESTGASLHRKVGHQRQLQGEIFRTFLAFCGMQYLNRSFVLGGSQKVPKNVGSPFMSIHKLFLIPIQRLGLNRN